MQKENLLIGSIFGVLAAIAYSSMATCVKLAEGINIEILVFFRNVISLGLLSSFLFRKKITIKTSRIKLHFVRALFGMLGLYSYFYAIRHLPLVNAILLSNTGPLFIPFVVFIWLKQKIPNRRFFAIFLGFLGIAVILQPSFDFAIAPSLIGLLSSVFIAIALTAVRQLSKTEQTESIMFYFFFFSILISFIPMVIRWESFGNEMWGYIIAVGIFATLFQYFITKAYTYIPATKASCFMYLSVIFGGIYGWVIFETAPNLSVILGTIMAVAGGAITLLDKKQAIDFKKSKKGS